MWKSVKVTGLLCLTLVACGGEGSADPVNEAPSVEIQSPVQGTVYVYGDVITLDASATDPEDGPLSELSLTWASDLDGPIGVGQTLEVQTLSFGVHTVTATALDSEGLASTATVTVEVSALHTAASWMTGHFSSAQQSVDDPTFYDITLHMARIWPVSTDGIWMYVEQSVTGSTPYRQRVYRLFEREGQVRDEIYRLPNEASYVGAWQTPEDFDTLLPQDLTLKPGCDVYFQWNAGSFGGGTAGKECSSDLNGASYATTEIVLTPALLTSWDQGWTASDQQVWGPTSGPYLFDKHADYPLQ